MVLDTDNLTFFLLNFAVICCSHLQIAAWSIVDLPRLLCRLLWKLAEMFEYTKNECRYLCICAERKKMFAQRFYLIYWSTYEGSIQFTREHGQLTHTHLHTSAVNGNFPTQRTWRLLIAAWASTYCRKATYVSPTYAEHQWRKLSMSHTISAVKLSANNNNFPQVLEHSEGLFASDETAPLTTTPTCPHNQLCSIVSSLIMYTNLSRHSYTITHTQAQTCTYMVSTFWHTDGDSLPV